MVNKRRLNEFFGIFIGKLERGRECGLSLLDWEQFGLKSKYFQTILRQFLGDLKLPGEPLMTF
jgi:hypothetical protein